MTLNQYIKNDNAFESTKVVKTTKRFKNVIK